MSILVSGVKAKLMGLEGWLKKASLLDSSLYVPYNDDRILQTIEDTIRRFEQEAQFRIKPVQKYTIVDDVYVHLVSGVPTTISDPTIPAVREDPYNYFADDASSFFRVPLRERPIIHVDRVKLAFNKTRAIYTIPNDWLQWETATGKLTIMPFTGSSALVGSAAWMSQILASLSSGDVIPLLINVDYSAGLSTGWENSHEWSALRRCIEEYSAYYVLQDIMEMIPQGLNRSTVGGDGISQSLEYSFFQQRSNALLVNVQKYQQLLRDQFTGFGMTVV